MTELTILAAQPMDAGEILTLQRAAYLTEAQLYGDPLIPPLTETIEELTADVAAGRVLKAVRGHRIVGTGRARPDGPVLHIGRLAVAPDRQGEGIGSRLLRALEDLAPARTERFVLFTGAKSEANLRLYERHGYTETHRGPGRTGVELIFLAKAALPRAPSAV